MEKSKLLLNTLAKFFAGIILVGVLLFLPAGTINYFNGWLFMLLLFVPMMILGFVLFFKAPDLLAKRLSSKEKEKTQQGVPWPYVLTKRFWKWISEQNKIILLGFESKLYKKSFWRHKKHANAIENRLYDDCTMEEVLKDNATYLEQAKKHNLNCILIEEKYEVDADEILLWVWKKSEITLVISNPCGK